MKNPATADKLCPTSYPFGAKRACVGTDYFETYNRDNVFPVNLNEDPIVGFTETGIKTARAESAFDHVIFCTGFDAPTGPLLRMDIRGRRACPFATSGSCNSTDGPRPLSRKAFMLPETWGPSSQCTYFAGGPNEFALDISGSATDDVHDRNPPALLEARSQIFVADSETICRWMANLSSFPLRRPK
ncbi:hypothetical protein [Arthrobacter sp. W4I7]|uniref:hypothetical protein n=1 Tax=Arthrobacter sp. W4I7 TaxID=3042296 RepID=UPI002780A56F|nr:hypothetical protein [Arthrobacter sp. W4I7]MDQ0691408.1 hypothetical protein [Arthrobacter sp. W4I7]